MELLQHFINLILHIDQQLLSVVATYHTFSYVILFGIVFAETGFIVTPFLPGDSLLFATGAIAATGALNIKIVILLLFTAALLGDNLNYSVGYFLGKKIYNSNFKLIQRKHIEKTQQFYSKYGGLTILFARYMPIVRTFAPFIAGASFMSYKKFLTFSIIGNLLWVNCFCLAGYLLGQVPFFKANFSTLILVIIAISFSPIVIMYIKQKLEKQKYGNHQPS